MAELVPGVGKAWFPFELFNGQVRIVSNETAENVGHVFLLLK